ETTSYTVSGLKASTPYTFRIRAFNVIGDSGYTNAVPVKTGSQFLVNLAGDAGTGSGLSGDIRYCINQANLPANAGSTIAFNLSALGSNIITLTKGQLVISNNMTLAGPNAYNLTISGNKSSRVFYISAPTAQVTITGLTI